MSSFQLFKKNLINKLIGKVNPEEDLIKNLLLLFFDNKKLDQVTASINNNLFNLNRDRFIFLIERNKIDKVIFKLLNNSKTSKLLSSEITNILFKRNNILDFAIEQRYRNSKKILSSLAKAKCHFVVMKSYLLQNSYFKNIYKLSEDLDLLVPISEFNKISEVLINSDYKYTPNLSEKDKYNFITYIHFYYPHPQEVFSKENHIVELHTSIIGIPNFYSIKDIINEEIIRRISNELFINSEKIKINGLFINIFNPEALIISLFLHTFVHHNYQGLYSFFEVAVVINKNKIDWNHINQIINKYKLDIYFNWYLSLLDYLFPNILEKNIKVKINNSRKKFSLIQEILFVYLKNKIANPTNYLKYPKKVKEKDWIWAIMRKRIIYVAKMRLKAKVINYIKTIINYCY